jgi:ribonuclease E
MLIDASHPEETRVVVLDGQKVEEFDFEAASRRPLKGNIYLAKVTRVEPSLQAAFVEYGGNRQGFLAFSEIHPDYYQIPVADRQALIAEAEAEARRRQDDDVESFEITSGPKGEAHEDTVEDSDIDEAPEAPAPQVVETVEESHDGEDEEEVFSNHEGAPEARATDDDAGAHDDHGHDHGHDDHSRDDHDHHHDRGMPSFAAPAEEGVSGEPDVSDTEDGDEDSNAVEELEGDEEFDEVAEASVEMPVEGAAEPAAADGSAPASQPLQTQRPPQRWMRRRHYKIQEVIKRRQIILVQVVKEERGNKGAALTTYLSLAGRYCVLMPNTPRGGGISRKITNAGDRSRLKAAAQALELPEGMGLIIRTAGENRTKVEIKRDYEYLLRMWDTIRELTLKSNAPACVYEEGDLIKRAIRDLYNKDVGEVLVEGEGGYQNAKDFMRMLMPSHAKNVKLYKEPVPLFHRHHIEAQLDAMFSPTVTLKSGGYIVINQTEALVSIDVNSGRATREHSIEETAHKTNLEAADEIARQLRLRDLAGLIVIDFIDMEDGRNDRDVERRLRDAVKNDRARVQIGKISQFGLMEMSRQRLRAGVIAGSTVPCPHCGGQGIVRSVESTSLRVLRGLEEEGQKLRSSAVTVRVASDVAIYTLNQKRKELARIESDYGMMISFEPKDGLLAGNFDIERTVQKTAEERAKYAVSVEAGFSLPQIEAEEEPNALEEEVDEAIEEEENIEDAAIASDDRESRPPRQAEEGGRRRRRRRGGRNRNRDRADRPRDNQQPQQNGEAQSLAPATEIEGGEDVFEDAAENGNDVDMQPRAEGVAQDGQQGDGQVRRRRRRRRRRGRGGQGEGNLRNGGEQQSLQAGEPAPSNGQAQPYFVAEDRFGRPEDEIDTTPREEATPDLRDTRAVSAPADAPAAPNAASTPVWSLDQDRSEPAREKAPAPVPPSEPEKPSGPARKGWWQRTFRTE